MTNNYTVLDHAKEENKTYKMLCISTVLNIILVVLLLVILNTTYTIECDDFVSEQKIIDYIIGRD